MIKWLFFPLMLAFFSMQAQENNCELLHLDKIHLGMSFGKFTDLANVDAMQMIKIKSEKLVVFDEYLLSSSDLVQKTYSFHLPEWMLDNVVPSDATLQSIETQYDKDYDIRGVLMTTFGAPQELRMPDAGIFFPFDARWKCKSPSGQTLQITLNHKRVLWELID
jgi:hypothetical protein